MLKYLNENIRHSTRTITFVFDVIITEYSNWGESYKNKLLDMICYANVSSIPCSKYVYCRMK